MIARMYKQGDTYVMEISYAFQQAMLMFSGRSPVGVVAIMLGFFEITGRELPDEIHFGLYAAGSWITTDIINKIEYSNN